MFFQRRAIPKMIWVIERVHIHVLETAFILDASSRMLASTWTHIGHGISVELVVLTVYKVGTKLQQVALIIFVKAYSQLRHNCRQKQVSAVPCWPLARPPATVCASRQI
jgi:hypothetical protein